MMSARKQKRSQVAGVLAATLLLAQCKPAAFGGSEVEPQSSAKPAGTASQHSSPIHWMHNTSEAFALAQRENKAVLVDLSATWCHTCKHMESTVFLDERLRPAGNKVVWLHIDVDKPEHEAFLKTQSYDALPTLLLLSAAGKELGRWVGALDTTELLSLVASGSVASSGSKLLADAAEASLRKDFPRVIAMTKAASREASRPLWERLNLSALNASAYAEANTEDPSVRDALADSGKQLTACLQDALKAKEPELREHADDISSAFEVLIDEPLSSPWAKAAWAPFLEARAKAAQSQAERAAYDPHRVLAYLARGKGELAIPMLQESQRDFPQDFNPPARLARVYRELGRIEEARASVKEARKLVYGPRTMRVLEEAWKIEAKAQNPAGVRAALESMVAYSGWLPKQAKALQEKARTALMQLP
jgi:tetratricopeptide (TPR) repeat protein